jgi:predicted methyltransferase
MPVPFIARRTLLAAAAVMSLFSAAPVFAADPALEAAVQGSWRDAGNKARDQYRHPVEALTFWGLMPGMTIVEVDPGAKGWWSEILAPYAKATGGRYIAALGNVKDANFWKEVADKSIYGDVLANTLTPQSSDLPANSVDFLLVARAFHNWSRQGDTTDTYMKTFYNTLKPGGILAVEQHRAPEGSDPKAGTGYVPESYVIAAAEKAGFKLEGRSEINANPKDTKDYPFGVWTLPPVRQSKDDTRTLTDAERAKYDAIGESDRMTLKFRKPG